jgi:hypothetical protein
MESLRLCRSLKAIANARQDGDGTPLTILEGEL